MSDQNPALAETPLASRAMRAATWRFATMTLSTAVQFAVGIVLARLLPPSDFGLIALAFLLAGLAKLVANLGLPNALVQRDVLTERHIRTAFTASILLGCFVSVVVWFAAPLSTLIFDEAELPGILRVYSLTFVINGFSNTAGALARRQLDFKTLFFVGIIGYLFGYAAVSIPMAVMGFGVWSFVAGRMGLVLVQSILLLSWVRHSIKPLIAPTELRHLLGFGTGNALNEFLQYLARSGDTFVVGRWVGGATPLGLYNRAFQQMRLASDSLGQLLVSVLFPTFAKLQSDPRRFGIAFLWSIELATLLTAPLMAGMVVAAPHLIVGLYGRNWVGSVQPFQVLALGGVLATLYPLATVAAEALGRVYAVSLRSGIFAAAVVILGIIAIPWGITGVSAAVVVSYGIIYIMTSSLAVQAAGVSRRKFLRAHVPGTAVAIVVGSVAMATRLGLERLQLPHLVILAVLIGACAISMWASIRWLPRSMRPDQLIAQIRASAPRVPARVDRLLEIILGDLEQPATGSGAEE